MCTESRSLRPGERAAALQAKPTYAEAHNYLGSAFYKQGGTAEAVWEFQEALRFKPDYAEARKNLEAALAGQSHPAPPR